MARLTVFVLALATSTAALAQAQAAGLSGVVQTVDGLPVPHVVLTLDGPGGARQAVSGPRGRYQLAGLAAGVYSLSTSAPGFVLSPSPTVTIADADVALDLTLAHAPVREHVVVTATRGEAALSTLGVSVTVLDRERIAERQASSLLQLLEEVPGLSVGRAGGLGLQASAFVRGGDSNYARVLVDGVPVNEPGGEHNFGPHLPLELERIEVLRGAGSSLYGSDALAGVIHVVTRRPDGDTPRLGLELEGGSLGWGRGQGDTAGRRGRFDWTLGALHLRTDNEEPNSALRETSGALSLGWTAGATELRAVLRGEDVEHGTPGPTAFGRPDRDASFDRRHLVGGAHVRHAQGALVHELRLGGSRMDWLSRNPLDSGPYVPTFGERRAPFTIFDAPDPLGFQHDTWRMLASYQVEAALRGRHLLTAGVEFEEQRGELGSRSEPLLSPQRTNLGAYVQDRVVLGRRAFLTAGARVERNDSFGTRLVPRAALAWRLREGAAATTLKGSAGAGIKEPSFFESFGVSFFAEGNPDLRPERSRTADVGFEQRLFGDRARLEATAFHHDYRDQIAYAVLDPVSFRGTFINLGRARAQGLEVSGEASPRRGLRLFGQYTLLAAKVVVSPSPFDPLYAPGKPLLRRPRHQASLSGSWKAGPATLGATVLRVGTRPDSDFAGLGLTTNSGYTRLDARARLAVTRTVELLAAAENLTDERYQDVLGYPARGRSLRAGVRIHGGGGQP
jgi:vitamin B12 transporter